MTQVLYERPSDGLNRWLHQYVKPQGVDIREIHRIATTTIRYLNASKDKRQVLRLDQQLEQRWYKAINDGWYDYSVYDDDLYLADLWACWAVYSRQYLLAMLDPKAMGRYSMCADLMPVKRVVDLGCGFGYTTLALKQMFPEAFVVGTNLADTVQWRILSGLMADTRSFAIDCDIRHIPAPVDLVFASEYFEHFPAPIAHLEDVLHTLKPRAMVVASTFNSPSIGHFPSYLVGNHYISGKATAKEFGNTMRKHGYVRVKANVWNNRPAYWRLGA